MLLASTWPSLLWLHCLFWIEPVRMVWVQKLQSKSAAQIFSLFIHAGLLSPCVILSRFGVTLGPCILCLPDLAHSEQRLKTLSLCVWCFHHVSMLLSRWLEERPRQLPLHHFYTYAITVVQDRGQVSWSVNQKPSSVWHSAAFIWGNLENTFNIWGAKRTGITNKGQLQHLCKQFIQYPWHKQWIKRWPSQ